MEPVVALCRFVKWALRRGLGNGRHYSDAGRHRAQHPVDVDGEVRVNVVDDLLSRVALDAADGLAARGRGLGRNGCPNLERYALRPRGAGERLGGRASETKGQAHGNATQRRDDDREPEKT